MSRSKHKVKANCFADKVFISVSFVARFINKTLESQRKQIEKSERQDQRDTDEEIEHEMANAKANLANEFEEKANAKKVTLASSPWRTRMVVCFESLLISWYCCFRKPQGKGKQRQVTEEEENDSDESDFDRMDFDNADDASVVSAPIAKGSSKTATKATSSRAKKALVRMQLGYQRRLSSYSTHANLVLLSIVQRRLG